MSQEQGKKKSIFKRWWFWVLLVIILIIIASANGKKPEKVGDNNTGSNVSENSNKGTNSEKDQTFKVGDQVKMGDSIVTVNTVEYSQGGGYSKPQEGNKWINLNVTIENTGSSQKYVTTMGQMFIRDGQGNSYQVAVTDKVMANPSFGLDGQIIAKSKRTGWVGFEILKDATNLQFQYNDSMFGGGNIVINLE